MSTEALPRPDAAVAVAPPAGRPLRTRSARTASRVSAPVVATMTWVPLVLVLDRGAGIWWQRLLGLGTWVLLLALLRRESPLVRAQVAVVVVFATAVEYTFSPLLEVYVYRLENVPAFVPPGHGLVYLCALAMGRSRWVRARLRACVVLTLACGGAYAVWGIAVSSRPDALGAFWYACLVGFLLWGRSRGLYVGAFVVVTYLEILGTWLGTWEWQPQDPTGLVSIGNPPSGAAGGYGWFDLAALLAAPTLLTAVTKATHSRPRTPPPRRPPPPHRPLTAPTPSPVIMHRWLRWGRRGPTPPQPSLHDHRGGVGRGTVGGLRATEGGPPQGVFDSRA